MVLRLAEEEQNELVNEGRSVMKSMPSSFLQLGLTIEDLQ